MSVAASAAGDGPASAGSRSPSDAGQRHASRHAALDAWSQVLDRIEESVAAAADAAASGDVDAVDAAAVALADAARPPASTYGPLPAALGLRARQILAAHADAAKAVNVRLEEIRGEMAGMAGRARRGNPAPTGNGASLDVDA